MSIFAAEGKLARFLNGLGNLMVLNILTILCSIPIVTIGAAMTALYTMTMRMARNEEGGLIAGYVRAFRDNFRQATILWGIGGGVTAFMIFDIWLLRSVTGTFGLVYRGILFALILLFLMFLVHTFAVLARFENTTKNTAKNALLFCVGNLPQAALMLVVTLLPILLLTVSYRFLSIDILFGISGPAYLAGIYFKSTFRVYENQELSSEKTEDSVY